MKHFSIYTRKTLTASILAVATAQVAFGDTITLSTIDGRTSVNGELLNYDGQNYVLRTSLGDLTLRASEAICDGEACPELLDETNNLFIAGSGTVTASLIPALTQAYFGTIGDTLKRQDDTGGTTFFEINRRDSQDLLMTLKHSNSSKGFEELIEGDLHAAFTTRPANDLEQQAAIDAGLKALRTEQQESVIAYDGLMMVTHPDNPVVAMTEMDIANVYSGKIDNWSAFGRDAGPIRVYVREENSNSRDLLQDVLLNPNRTKLSENLIVLESDSEIAEAVRNDPDAIGLTSFVHREGVKALEIEGVCGIRIPANEFTIKTGEYLLSRPVYFYHNADIAHDGVTGFAEFLNTAEARTVMREAGFVDREIITKPLNDQGLRVSHTIMLDEAFQNISGTKSMLQLMSRSVRLSTTIRFGNGSTDLDATDYEDLEVLADLVRSPEYAGSNFYFMGFSDSIGRADLNQFLALQRAEIVRQALVSRHPDLADRLVARSIGYGELSPLACNETRPGRNVNRRVEVWVQNPMTTLASKDIN